MELIHLFLNTLCLLLWFDWRTARISEAIPARPATLGGALNRTGGGSSKRNSSLLLLAAILLLRPVLYNALTHGATWTPLTELYVISLPWRSDDVWRMLLFSWVSFGQWMLVAYAWMAALVRVNHMRGEDDPTHRLLHTQLGRLNRLPLAVRLALPALVVCLFWMTFAGLFAKLGMIPVPKSFFHVLGQSMVLGVWHLLIYRWLLVGLLAVHLAQLLVFAGEHPWLRYPRLAARSFSSRFNFMRLVLGRFDATDLALIAAITVGSELLIRLGIHLFLAIGL